MHSDARLLESGVQLEADLCIVGAGAAGIAIALEWNRTAHRVILLEGGGFELEQHVQDLYRGQIIGRDYYPLEAAALHYFGGTTGHWAGFCSPLDPADFEARPWVPESGWPLRKADLDPYYSRAHPILEIGPYEYDPEYWEERSPHRRRLPLDQNVVATKMWQFSPPTRFGARYRTALVESSNLHLLTHANACEVLVSASSTEVRGVRVRAADKTVEVRARYYVLACGAIQNARLLMASGNTERGGLGNTHDTVGRYFMEHLEIPAAELVLRPQSASVVAMYAFRFGHTRVRGELALTRNAQREHGILNATAALREGYLGEEVGSTFQENPPSTLEEFRVSTREMPARDGAEEEGSSEYEPARVFHLTTRQEQAPNRRSRVVLTRARDAMQMPRVALDWQLTALDRRSMRVFFEILAREVGCRELGRVRIRSWLQDDTEPWPSNLSGAWHQMGTTRMHVDPKHGVVNADCQVHAYHNLYVAGASVFPTGGAANPTLTIVALAIRLADHLKRLV